MQRRYGKPTLISWPCPEPWGKGWQCLENIAFNFNFNWATSAHEQNASNGCASNDSMHDKFIKLAATTYAVPGDETRVIKTNLRLIRGLVNSSHQDKSTNGGFSPMSSSVVKSIQAELETKKLVGALVAHLFHLADSARCYCWAASVCLSDISGAVLGLPRPLSP